MARTPVTSNEGGAGLLVTGNTTTGIADGHKVIVKGNVTWIHATQSDATSRTITVKTPGVVGEAALEIPEFTQLMVQNSVYLLGPFESSIYVQPTDRPYLHVDYEGGLHASFEIYPFHNPY